MPQLNSSETADLSSMSNNATKALLFLHTRSFVNRLRVQLARARNPRYLAAIVLSCLYFWWLFFQNGGATQGSIHSFLANDSISVIGSALLLFLGAKWWLFKNDRSSLAFIPAEVQFLFPAPVSRRSLIHAKLLRMQSMILANTIIFAVLLRGGVSSLESWNRGLSLWVLITTISLHRLAAGILRSSALEHGSAGRRRAFIPITIFGLMLGAVVYSLLMHLPELSAASAGGFRSTLPALVTVLKAPPASIALWPTRILLSPLLTVGSSAWVISILGSVAVLVFHYLWVLKLDVAFEEAALEATRHRTERIQRFRASQMGKARSRKGALRKLPALSPHGRPEVAIIWKNIAAALRGGGWRNQLILLVVITIALAIISTQTTMFPLDFLIGLTASWVMMLVILGPTTVRFDLRLDLPQLAVLKTYPISGQRLVVAEVAGVTILHTITIWSLMVVPIFVVLRNPSGLLSIESPGALAATVMLSVPGINALLFTVHNGVALLFPAWVRLGTEPGRFEAMGQNMLTMGATTLVALVALVFPVGIGALVTWLSQSAGTWPAAMAGLAVGVLILLAELWPVLYWLGSVFDKIDVGEVVGQQVAGTTSSV